MRYRELALWAERTRVPFLVAEKLHVLVQTRSVQAARQCNGDPHPRVADKADKNANATAWSKDENQTLAEIRSLLAPLGLAYDAGTGLWGTILRGREQLGPLPDCYTERERQRAFQRTRVAK